MSVGKEKQNRDQGLLNPWLSWEENGPSGQKMKDLSLRFYLMAEQV